MTPEAQRIAIAEACGYRMVEFPYAYPSIDMIKARVPPEVFDQLLTYGYERIPDYLSDLNACHEMEKLLTDEQHALFRKLLFTGFYNRGEGTTNEAAERARVSATSEQRCESFLKAKNIWTE